MPCGRDCAGAGVGCISGVVCDAVQTGGGMAEGRGSGRWRGRGVRIGYSEAPLLLALELLLFYGCSYMLHLSGR